VQASAAGLEPFLNRVVAPGSLSAQQAVAPTFTALDAFGTYTARLSATQIAQLTADPHIRQVSPDRPIRTCQDYLTQTVGANVAWKSYGVTGKGVTVAVLDTGLSLHSDLVIPSPRVVGWMDLVGHSALPYDDNGHGTHVAGILAGDGFTAATHHYDTSLQRIAPGVSLIGVKVLDQTGSGSVSTVIVGINWCIANQARLHIRIINLSLGHPVAESYQTDPLCQACERAWAAGILVVCAAGNQGRSVATDPTSPPAYGTIVSPGNDPYVLTVGATNTFGTLSRADDDIASYSSRGPSAIDCILKPDIVAPGNQINSLAVPGSLLFTQYSADRVTPTMFDGTGPVSYYCLSGTSMAAPVVAGAAALMLQADPTLTPDAIKARLMVAADKSKRFDPFTYGAGYLDIPGALACRVGAPLGALSPVTYAYAGTVTISNSFWGSNAVWGDNAIWGSSGKGYSLIWGASSWLTNLSSNSNLWNGSLVPMGSATDADLTQILLHGD
jgi:serine protease AprX